MKQENHHTPRVVDLVRRLYGSEDEALAAGRRRAEEAGMPLIEVAPEDGAILAALVAAISPRRVVEIGTLFGYSAIWMARTLPPDGKIVSVESEARHAEVAALNIEAAGMGDRVEILVGDAGEMLAAVETPVDLVFIDADKAGYPEYLEWARGALRPGGVVLGDNAFLSGGVVEPTSQSTKAMRVFLERLAADPAWIGAMIPTLEGLALGVRTVAT
jgi:predicted O-methyltransferase YrrM